MIRAIKKALLKIVGVEYVLEFVAEMIGQGIVNLNSKLEIDVFVYKLGGKIRNKLPGESIEINAAHILKSFKAGLLGDNFPEKELEEIGIEEEVKN